ncbi:hypothetical protein CK226_16405 [Mesorhizobium sp. WSM4311]|nr:hypothetical protein CK226_16405 [Mesorhizobium sp. WSM4311]TRD07737.1 hypothetical protein FJV82_03340 [Mesorhizobium sp. WSM4305]
MNPQGKFKCRVCGLDQSPDMPWGESGGEPSYAICSCCGVEFGYEDDGKALATAHLRLAPMPFFDPEGMRLRGVARLAWNRFGFPSGSMI